MMLGLLVYGYAKGVQASRKIERARHDPVAFRFIAANTQPALSWAPAQKIEAQLREEVQLLFKLAEQSDE